MVKEIDITLKVTYKYINRNMINVTILYLYSYLNEIDDHDKEIIYENNNYVKELYKKLYDKIIKENFNYIYNIILIERI